MGAWQCGMLGWQHETICMHGRPEAACMGAHEPTEVLPNTHVSSSVERSIA